MQESMGLTFLTGYILGQHGAQSARLAASASGSGGAGATDILDLHERVDRLTLALDAMWSLLEDSGYTDEQLKARIEHIDAADGTIDGRRTPQVSTCRSCGARVAAGLRACQFCGNDLPEAPEDPFSSV